MKNFRYIPYTKKYKDSVLELLCANLWDFSMVDAVKYFNWKYEDNPYTDCPLAFIALDGDVVVAFRGYMVMPLQIGTTVKLNAQLSDTATHMEYRRMGLFQNLTLYSISEIEKNKDYVVSFNSSSGGKTLVGYERLGWKSFSERKHLFHFTLQGCVRKFLNKPKKWENQKIVNGCYRVVFSDKCDAKCLSSFSDTRKFSHVRDEKFYAWRFKNPLSIFRYVYLYEDGRLCAFIVLLDMGGARYDIIDFYCEEETSMRRMLKLIDSRLKPFFSFFMDCR